MANPPGPIAPSRPECRDRIHWRSTVSLAAAVILSLGSGFKLEAQATYTSYTFATLAGDRVGAEGPASSVQLKGPLGVAVDGNGNVYFTDQSNRILKLSTGGIVTTVAGEAGIQGGADGLGGAAQFSYPYGIAVDSNGNIYAADTANFTIRKITPGGAVITLAGTAGVQGSADGVGSAARFSYPNGVAVDSSGNVYVADTGNCTIRKITAGGVVTTLAGRAGVNGGSDGMGSSASFSYPQGLAVDQGGNVYVADTDNFTIRKVTPQGIVSTLAGTTGVEGSADGLGSAAQFLTPISVAVDQNGDIYVGDGYVGYSSNSKIREISPDGVVTTLFENAFVAANLTIQFGAEQEITPSGLAIGPGGSLYLADSQNKVIWAISPSGVLSMAAGSNGGAGSSDGTGAAARFNKPMGCALDSAGNLYLADNHNCTIRMVTPLGVVTTVSGMAGFKGYRDGTGEFPLFDSPTSVAVDGAGNVYVADGDVVRKIAPGGVVTTLAGTAGVNGSADGTGTAAQFSYLGGLAVDASGNVYVADTGNNTIRKITPAGVVSTIAGAANATVGSADGVGAAARFNQPAAVAVDGNGYVYVADSSFDTGFGFVANNMIRKISPAGVVTTLAGAPSYEETLNGVTSGNFVASADGAGTSARFNDPTGIAVDSAGNVYVADSGNNTIRRVTPNGVVTTLAGSAGVPGDTDGTGNTAQFSNPTGIAMDGNGNLFVVDSGNNTIRVGAFDAPPSLPSEPAFSTQMISQAVVSGGAAEFSVSSSTSPSPTYQWYFDGEAITGATQPTLAVSNVTAGNSGYYDCVATNSFGTITSSATLAVLGSPDPGRIINVSCRAQVGTGSNILIAGFVVGGVGSSGSQPVLIRGTGPALVPFGVTDTLSDPQLQIYSGSTVVGTNNGWGGDSAISSEDSAVGAFPFSNPSSHDSALLENLQSGSYTAQVAGQSGDTGVALVEVYDATPEGALSQASPHLINISARVQVGSGDNILIAGFVIGGSTSETLLIRASGPALVPFGVPGTLPDPQLRLYSGSSLLGTSNGWFGNLAISNAASSVGGFAWNDPTSHDSAILVTLPPGAYTAQVSGESGDTGVALIELYEVP